MICPTRPRWTASGLTMMKVRSRCFGAEAMPRLMQRTRGASRLDRRSARQRAARRTCRACTRGRGAARGGGGLPPAGGRRGGGAACRASRCEATHGRGRQRAHPRPCRLPRHGQRPHRGSAAPRTRGLHEIFCSTRRESTATCEIRGGVGESVDKRPGTQIAATRDGGARRSRTILE